MFLMIDPHNIELVIKALIASYIDSRQCSKAFMLQK